MKAEVGHPPDASGGLLTRGHPLAVAAVRRFIDRASAPHALLLLGPRGVGKTTLALDLAAGLLCLSDDPRQRPCRACPACRKVGHGNHPDLHRVAPEGAGEQIRLGQVQALTADLALLPMEGRIRVAIIESAQRLNPDAQNALLKTLEEPVGAACIILCADEESQILPTVVSRSARLRLGAVPSAAISSLLVERGAVDAARAGHLAGASGGRPGVALALAARPDAVLALGRLARQLLDLLGADRRTRLAAVSDLVAEGATLDGMLRGEVAADEGDESDEGDAIPAGGPRRGARKPSPVERRRAAQRVLSTWREVGRDLAVAVGGGRRGIRRLDLLEDLEAAAPQVQAARLLRFLDRLDGLTAAIDGYASPELVLDVLVLAWPSLDPAA